MEAKEIKSAWNKFKKDVQKETGIDLTGCCYMNAKQIENRTATICLVNDIDYDREIARERRSIEQVNGYETWTDEEKQSHERRSLESIAFYEARKAEYGTKENEAQVEFDQITNSKAYKVLAEAIGIENVWLELVEKWKGLSCYQIRISY